MVEVRQGEKRAESDHLAPLTAHLHNWQEVIDLLDCGKILGVKDMTVFGWYARGRVTRENELREQITQSSGSLKALRHSYFVELQHNGDGIGGEWVLTLRQDESVRGDLNFTSWDELMKFSHYGGLFGQELTDYEWR